MCKARGVCKVKQRKEKEKGKQFPFPQGGIGMTQKKGLFAKRTQSLDRGEEAMYLIVNKIGGFFGQPRQIGFTQNEAKNPGVSPVWHTASKTAPSWSRL